MHWDFSYPAGWLAEVLPDIVCSWPPPALRRRRARARARATTGGGHTRLAARRAQQDQRVTKVRAAREAKQWRRHHSRQHNQGRSADGSFHQGAKRKRGTGTARTMLLIVALLSRGVTAAESPPLEAVFSCSLTTCMSPLRYNNVVSQTDTHRPHTGTNWSNVRHGPTTIAQHAHMISRKITNR
jgi:hypothetical protein